jgi:DNA repair protein RadD
MELRPYQQAAVESVYCYLREQDGNPVVCIPPAGGKTPILATIASDAVNLWNGRVLVVTHVRELVEQAVDKLRRVCPGLPVGVFSAGLKRRDTEQSVIAASIQSIYRRACELGRFDLIIVDEAHLLPPDGDGMYRSFLSDARVINPHVRLIGLTATPYRLDSGLIYGPNNLLTDICFEAGIRDLIRDGYLCPLISKAGQQKADLENLHIRQGEFLADEVDEAMDRDDLVESACAEIVDATRHRNACLIFASSINHAAHICRVLQVDHDIECGFVCGETPSDRRSELLARFRRESSGGLFPHKPLKYLCNVGVLTTGFDAPVTDAIAILRPTNSPGLLVQMVGRGLRLHPEKHDTLILDFGGNIERHGPIDRITIKTIERSADGEAPAKECPDCHSLISSGYSACPDCGHIFPTQKREKHAGTASEAGLFSDQFTDETYDVLDVSYHVHTKRGADEDAPKTMRVDYRLGLTFHVSEWVCVEHEGYAGAKAAVWWRDRSPDPMPEIAQRAVEIADGGGLAWTQRITVRSWPGRRWPEVVHVELGDMPEPCAAPADSGLFGDSIDLDDLPF